MKQMYEIAGKLAYVMKHGREFNEGEGLVWTIRVYPETAQARAAIKATGIKNSAREDTGEISGVQGWYFTFRSKSQPLIVDTNGDIIEAMIGNGSTGRVFLEVDAFVSPSYGKQARSEVKKIVIDNLIEYNPPERDTIAIGPDGAAADLPADSPSGGSGRVPGDRKTAVDLDDKIPF
jgi:hypothetical protein